MSDPYRVLGLQPGASPQDIRRAYFSQVRAHPPEKEPEAFKAVRAAYEKLCELPDQCDLFRLQEPAGWNAHHALPAADVQFHPEDALAALQAWGDLGRRDFSDDFREVNL